MIWALKDNIRAEAKPKDKAICPICLAEVISKCGVVKKWHWAHKDISDCDSWAEPESEWHLNWKNEFPKEFQEYVIEKDSIKHRADVRLPNFEVIELQNSNISADDICDREVFYDDMIWVINGETLGKNLEIREKPSYITFIWKNPPQSFFCADKNIYVDLSKEVTELIEMREDCLERLKIISDELKEITGTSDLNTYNFDKFKYGFRLGSEEKPLFDKYKIWSDLSKEYRIYENKLKIFSSGSIFRIKKLYKKLPCAGWGYLIKKGDFINGQR